MTFTSKIKFKDVIISIANFAFVASAYPVVLSLEMHCSLPQQERTRYLFITPCLALEIHCSLPQHASSFPSYHPMPRPRDALRTY